jgi:hypothetical protein
MLAASAAAFAILHTANTAMSFAPLVWQDGRAALHAIDNIAPTLSVLKDPASDLAKPAPDLPGTVDVQSGIAATLIAELLRDCPVTFDPLT